MKKSVGNVLLTWLFYKYETAIFCKVFNVNRLAEGKPVFSQTIGDFSPTGGNFSSKKSSESAVNPLFFVSLQACGGFILMKR